MDQSLSQPVTRELCQQTMATTTCGEYDRIIFSASSASLLSPLCSYIYFPGLEAVSNDLNVSDTVVNLSISTYIIFQGIRPTFRRQLSDTVGRRPVYLIRLVLFLDSSLGIGIQNNYTALLVLPCFQNTDSSGMPAVSNAVAADIATRFLLRQWL